MKAKTNPPFRTLTHEETSARARQLWEEQGAPEGRDVEFWLEAECQLRAAPARSAAPTRETFSTKLKDGDRIRAKTDELLESAGEPEVRSPTSLNLGRS